MVIPSRAPRSAHLILASSLSRSGRVVRAELVGDLDVEIALVLIVGLVLKDALDLLALLDGEDVLEVEYGLLPVGVLGVRAGGEADGLVTGGEIDIEPGDQGVHEVVPAAVEGEWEGEGQIGSRAGVEVEGENGSGVGDNGLDLDRVDEGLRESCVLERSVVKAIDVVPDCCVLALRWTT